EATAVCEREVLRLVDRYSKDTVVEAMQETQDYVCRTVLASLGDLPRGEWETVDYLDGDPAKGAGLAPIRVKLSLDGSGIDCAHPGTAEAVSTCLPPGSGTTFSATSAGTRSVYPDVPLSSGFYEAVTAEIGEEGTVVNAGWPHAVTGF